MAIGDVIARLSVSLGLETAAFDKGAKDAAGKVGKLQAGISKFGSAVAGAFVASGVVAGIQEFTNASRQALDAVGGLGEAAAAVGVTTDALQEFRYAATQVGLSTEQMDGILAQFSKRLGEGLLTGKGKFVAALGEIGVSLDQLKGKSTTEQFAIIADGLQKVGSEAERSALLTQFFGKQGQAAASLLADGAAGVRQYADDARKLGIVVSEAQIKQADAAADQISALERVAEAQRNAVLTTPENIKVTLEYAKGMAELKMAATSAFAAFVRGAGDNDAAMKRIRESVIGALHGFADAINGAMQRAHAYVANFANLGRDLVLGLVRGIRNAGPAAWEAIKGVVSGAIEAAKKKLDSHSPSRVFIEIGDYIGQGLAIGIEGGTGRVAAATRKLTEAARQAAEETKTLLARLFPELERANQYRDDLKTIAASNLSEDAKGEARFRLGREFAGATGDVPVSLLDDPVANGERFQQAMEKVTDAIGGFKDKAQVTTVAVAKSFKDMADATLQSLNNLAGAIKGGGFLNILNAVIGLGLQLGSIGAFGKTIAGRINASKIPGNANGTNNWRGGLSWVGERGPELVNLPRGAQVLSNRESMGLMGGKLQVEVVANNDGFGAIVRNHAGQVVAEAAGPIMDGGARVAQKRIGYAQRRRVG